VPSRLSSRDADFRELDAVVGEFRTIWDRRIAELVDHPLIKLGILAVDNESNFLIVRAADVTDYALGSERRADRSAPYACPSRTFVAVGDAIQLMNCSSNSLIDERT